MRNEAPSGGEVGGTMTDHMTDRERRRHPRLAVTPEVRCRLNLDSEEATRIFSVGQLVDFSLEGFCVVCGVVDPAANPASVQGQEVDLEVLIPPHEEVVLFKGRVVWWKSDPDPRPASIWMGVLLASPHLTVVERLRALVA